MYSPQARRSVRRRLAGVWLIVIAAALSLPAPAVPQQPSISLTPSRAEGEATAGSPVGPFTIQNGTQDRYSVRVFPILLGQRPDGGLVVRDDAAALADARRLLRVQVRRFGLAPGGARSVLALVKRVPASGAIYGGVLFQARPSGEPEGGGRITNVLQLNASLLLRPARQRLRFASDRIRAEQAGPRRLRLLVPVTNRGNADAAVSGTVAIRDARGKRIGEERLRGFDILPGATVELPAVVKQKLRPGAYTLAATLEAGGRTLRSRGALRLFGVNQIRTQGARLLDFPSPEAYTGEKFDVRATFENTGNVDYAPQAVLEARPVARGGRGRVALTEPMRVEEAAPGEKGKLTASVTLSDEAESYALTVRLLDGKRELDARSVSVTPAEKPPLLERVGDTLTENALPIIAALAALLTLAAIVGIRYVRRLRAAAAEAQEAARSSAAERAETEREQDDTRIDARP